MKISIDTKFSFPRLNYVLSFLNANPLLSDCMAFSLNGESADVRISYGLEKDENSKKFFIKAQDYFFSDKHQIKNLVLFANAYSYESYKVHSVEITQQPSQSFLVDKVFAFDFLEAIFFHISRVEELDVKEELLNDRAQITEEELFSIKNRIEHYPVVDRLIALLKEIFLGDLPNVATSLTFSHDIDFIRKFKGPFSFSKKLIGTVLSRKNIKELLNQKEALRKDKMDDPYNTFDKILTYREDVQKKIFFLMGGGHAYDNVYELNDPIFKKAIKVCRERNYEIGVHPSFESWQDINLILREKERLEKYLGHSIKISRQHYLHFDITRTPSLLLEAGIEEDFSLGFTKHVGFRCGTGFPYRLYDFEKEEESNLIECPLVFMDSSAINQSKREETDLEILAQAFLLSNTNGTHITLNFHNSRFDKTEPYFESLEKALKLFQSFGLPS